MDNQDLLNGLKDTLLVPRSISDFDKILSMYLTGSQSYVDSILDNDFKAKNDPIYKLTIIYLAQFYYLNRDNSRMKYLPVTINSLLNRLKFKYHQ